ncbi:MAG TPA: GDSL-type esterase/lipase family protein [Capsulimonadaceae bacterium]|jgi:hypothetical protein
MPLNKKLIALLTLISLVSPAILLAEPLVKPNDIVAICGDSITQQKRYSVLIEDYLLMCQPSSNVHAVQFGSNGAGAYVLGSRINSLALFHPTVATMLYGMNDGQYKPLNDERASGFRKGMNDSLDALKKIGVDRVVVASPDFIESANNPASATTYNVTLASLGEISRSVAGERGVVYTDNHAYMESAIRKIRAANPDAKFNLFDVHPELSGHIMIAYSFLKGMGFDGAIGTITADLVTGKAIGSDGHKVLSMANGKIEIESTRYPFCFVGDPEKIGPDTATAVKYLPFNDDLNRYILIVHGIKTQNAKVTWGDQSKSIPAADLEKGVNLAALFVPGNPFSAPFAKVDAAIREKQSAETTLTWQYLANIGRLKQALPNQEPIFDQIQQGGFDEVQRLNRACAGLVMPVRHSIVIEPQQ